MEYKRLTHRNGENIEEYCEVGHCKYADFCICNFKGLQHNVDDECVPAMIERLAELEDKIDQGTLIELHCKIGDIVYETEGVRIYEHKIDRIIYVDKMLIYDINEIMFDERAIGVSIFLTREEAEKRLLELQGDKK